MFYTVMVDGRPHGEIFKLRGRWRWARPNAMGIETYHRAATMLTVREHIKRLNKVTIAQVRLTKQEKANG